MADRSDVIWALDPFKTGTGNPRPWLVIAADRLPYPDKESIAVAFTTQSHHPGSFTVPSSAWVRGEPQQQGYVLPWSLATLKDDLHIVGKQGTVTAVFTNKVATATSSYFEESYSSE